MSRVRYEITFTGRVQGVGFRATTVGVAQGFNISGWVRNEPDGSVRCVAECEVDELNRFVSAIKQAMSGYIRDVRVSQASATGEFADFRIKH